MRVKKPDYPLDQLASFELRDYREKLETALTDTLTPAERQLFDERLTDVIAEQAERAKAELASVGQSGIP